MYNYGPGQSNPGGQFPDNSANNPYGSPPQQPQSPYQQDPNAYPQQPQDPNAYPQQPPVSPTQPYDPSPAVTSGPPASPSPYGAAAPVPAMPTAPVTGPGPMDTSMFGGPNPMLPPPAPAKSKSSALVATLAGVSALMLIGMVVFMVLFFGTKGDLTDARTTVSDNEDTIDAKDKEIKDLEDDKKDAEEVAKDSEECIKLVEDMFTELYKSKPDAENLDRILDEMEGKCQSS